jgi:EAL domain-containing protein (putative c-di-GMP-specific phosphodiesterase class I)
MRRLAERERFLAYAFTAAEMLLETDGDGRILFAAGAFQSRFGAPAESFIGRPAEQLFASVDQQSFATGFALLAARGRLAPVCFRLADAAATPMALAGLLLPQPEGNSYCLTVSAMPTAQPAKAALAREGSLGQSAEARLREAPGGALGLFELAGPDGPISPRPELAARLGAALSEASSGSLAGELVAGRYGVLSSTSVDLAAIAGRLETVLADAGVPGTVARSSLALATDGLSSLQATRALRYALASFANGGAAALTREGFGGGLAGFVAQACAKAKELRRTIADRRFRLAFQPIVSLTDRKVHHYEALLRPTPSEAVPMAQAQEFVAFAETVGLSEELDWAVVETVCEEARGAGKARIACNLSGLSVQSPAFRARLLALLDAEPELVPQLLVEITETAEIESEAEAVATVEALRARKLPLCIDDFGAGAAAFRYLRTFRVDYVKIDGLYVQSAMRSEQDRGFLGAMVELARNVGAKVVAEKIESEEEATAMLELGIGYGQGWLFGRPGLLPGTI